MVDKWHNDISGARADLSKSVQGGISLDKGWIRQPRNYHLHEFRNMRHGIFTSNACQFSEAHENISRNSGIAIIGFLEKHAEHWEGIRLYESLSGADEKC